MSEFPKTLKVSNVRSGTALAFPKTLTTPLPDNTVVRREILYTLLRCLLDFGRDQLDFVTNGVHIDENIQPQPVFPPAQPFNVFADKIGYDLDIFSSAMHQRINETLIFGKSNFAPVATLENADIYADMLLSPAVNAGLIPPVTPITYYQQRYCARVIPYAPVALIGIPFTATGVPRNLALVAHEVGHYVYSRMHAPGLSIAEIPTWMRTWWEEIFADVYGCLVGGPLTASALLTLQGDLAIKDLSYDDGEYPIPILRPTIFLATLRRMTHAAKAAGLLRETEYLTEWLAILETEGAMWRTEAPDWNTVTMRHGQTISIAQATVWLNRAVDILLSDGILGSLLPPNCAMHLWDTPAEPNYISIGAINAAEMAQRRIISGLEQHSGKFGWNLPLLAFWGAESWATKGPGPGNPQPTGR